MPWGALFTAYFDQVLNTWIGCTIKLVQVKSTQLTKQVFAKVKPLCVAKVNDVCGCRAHRSPQGAGLELWL